MATANAKRKALKNAKKGEKTIDGIGGKTPFAKKTLKERKVVVGKMRGKGDEEKHFDRNALAKKADVKNAVAKKTAAEKKGSVDGGYVVCTVYCEKGGSHVIRETWRCGSALKAKKVVCEALDLCKDGKGRPKEPDSSDYEKMREFCDETYARQEFRRMKSAYETYLKMSEDLKRGHCRAYDLGRQCGFSVSVATARG